MTAKSKENESKLKKIAWLIDPNNPLGYYGTNQSNEIQKILDQK